MASIYKGYTGMATIDGSTVRFASCSLAAKQAIEVPDIVMGSQDRVAYVYGKVDVSGSLSGPLTEGMTNSGFFDWAGQRTGDCPDLLTKAVDVTYFCGTSRNFPAMAVNSLNFSVSAGEIAQYTLELIGKTEPTAGGGTSDPNPEKVITWDQVAITVGGEGAPVTSIPFSDFQLNINNNVEAVYALGEGDLYAFELVPGIRTIDGSITFFGVPEFNGYDAFGDYCAADVGTIGLSIAASCTGAAISADMNVRFHRVEPSGTPGLVTSTVAFTGVTEQSGGIWG